MTCWYFWLRSRGPRGDSGWLTDLSKLENTAEAAATVISAPEERGVACAGSLVRMGVVQMRKWKAKAGNAGARP